ncbi:hypothetical protein [Pedobacter sp. MC2016-24]|uniref:hypothetical protein n=1 Tax=Pedobacter sp. MC2016-24 TaxID=2780090 RepID=UPI0018811866|nr:hypothetical protein [Pedobacter sp. MC2016-24]MBE9599952.1 hypothetical protein [Pedobacter sp. MC2016-24]
MSESLILVNSIRYIPRPKGVINSRAFFTELIDEHTLRTFGPNRIPYCQTNDIEDVKNILTEDKKFIHTIDQADEFTDLMVNNIEALFTPSMVSFLKDQDKPFIYMLSIEQLRDDTFDKPIEFMSPRGYRNVIEASRVRKNKTSDYNEVELKIIEMGEIELKFEEVRREICDWAPSRLSAIYLMDYSESSAENMRKMFWNTIRKEPKVIIVCIAGLARIIKVDYRWFEAYIKEKNNEYIKNYWQSKPFVEGSTTWEYLHEGGLFPLDEEYDPYQ